MPPPSLFSPLSFSSSLECRTHSAPCSFDRVAPSPFISYSSLGPPAVFVAGSPRSHSDSVTWPQIAISRLPSSLAAPSGPSGPHLFLLGGEPFVSAHGHLLAPSLPLRPPIYQEADLLASRHPRSGREREEGRGRPAVTSNDARGGVRCVCARGTSSRRNRTSERGNERTSTLVGKRSSMIPEEQDVQG